MALLVVAALLAASAVVALVATIDRQRDVGVADREVSSPAPAPSGASGGLARFYDQQIDWQRCGDAYQCGRLEVPVDYADPAGASIQLALLRVPARDKDRRLGSLIVNPGGPGGSGVDYAAAADGIVSPAVRDRYDLVGFDPRGVDRSEPVDCLSDAQLDAFLAADPTPDDKREVSGLVGADKEFAAGCRMRAGALLAHVGTAGVARDLDVLRGALGDERLHYLGKSYGTLIGAEYLRLFPRRAGRVVLDGAVDPALTAEQFALGQASGFEQALTSFLADCVRHDCPLGADVTTARAGLTRLLGRLDAQPLPTRSGRRLTEALAVLGVAYPLYLPPDRGYPALRAALHEALGGDGSALLGLSDDYTQRHPDGSYDGNSNEAIYAVNCLDRQDVTGPAQVAAQLPTFERASPTFGRYIAWSGLPCAYWPVPPSGRPAPVAAPGAPPVLVVGTTGDPATPYAWAVSLAEQLDSGVLLTYVGSGHTAYRHGSSCIDDAVDRYLLEGQPPAAGTRCR